MVPNHLSGCTSNQPTNLVQFHGESGNHSNFMFAFTKTASVLKPVLYFCGRFRLILYLITKNNLLTSVKYVDWQIAAGVTENP